VSALAYYLEDQGIPAVAISLIRLHSEKIANPRSLWVPFELGRPFGPPGNAAFQTRVIATALGLLTAAPGPVLLADFPDDDPTTVELPGWQPPFDLPPIDTDLTDQTALARAVTQELRAVAPSYDRFVAASRRTTVGLSGLGLADAALYIAASLADPPPPSPDAAVAAVQMLRWAVDDVKAYYLEAMAAGPGIPASRQMQAWFWDRSVAARLIIALRARLLASAEPRSQAVGRMNLVPGAQVARLGLG